MNTYAMEIASLGESALILRELPHPPWVVASHLNKLYGDRLEAAPAFETVGVYYYREPLPGEELNRSCLEAVDEGVEKWHEIPVCYELGLDFLAACRVLGLSDSEMISKHAAQEYRCVAVGFQPGFPYLQGLDQRLSGLARREAPRVSVPVGSVAITGRQTGIYPVECPGGWWLVGRTPLSIVDVTRNYFPISAGDWIRFRAIDADEFARLQGAEL